MYTQNIIYKLLLTVFEELYIKNYCKPVVFMHLHSCAEIFKKLEF